MVLPREDVVLRVEALCADVFFFFEVAVLRPELEVFLPVRERCAMSRLLSAVSREKEDYVAPARVRQLRPAIGASVTVCT
jgi:hypothetical protein